MQFHLSLVKHSPRAEAADFLCVGRQELQIVFKLTSTRKDSSLCVSMALVPIYLF